MKYWLTTDTHFGHDKMLEIGRPADYEQRILRGLSALKQEDVLIHLGDVCIGNDESNHAKFIVPLSVKKVLVKGNHDKKSDTWYLQNGWDFVCDSFSFNKFGKRLLFTHVPQAKRPDFDLNFHGHIHEAIHREYNPQDHHRCISLEVQGYQPQNLEKLL